MLQNLAQNINRDRRHGGNVESYPRCNGDIKKSTCIAPISDRSRFSLDTTVFSSKFAYLLAQNIFNLDLKLLSLCDCTIAAMQITHYPLISDHFHYSKYQ